MKRAATSWLSVTMDSVCREPYRLMCSIASLTPSTILIEMIRSEYSFFQSSSPASRTSCPPANSKGLGSPRTSTPAARNCAIICGRNAGAMSRWTSNGSVELQAVGDSFPVAQHGNAGVFSNVADELLGATWHDHVDLTMHCQNQGHVFARPQQNDGVGGNVCEWLESFAPDRKQHRVALPRLRAALAAPSIPG